ncbi:hypothetical protein O1611_g3363 [Lasiodiplodia mahajangana]|uniref:Uncharacterized protein n=1 Tax=Lasiodiplodia mahajangana TaxID=1108764 RepID=A0ACC2JS00_9PEZI|nr:hypothetical protein O1611_g3363 [Lasiodiplodia mahajangana]
MGAQQQPNPAGVREVGISVLVRKRKSSNAASVTACHHTPYTIPPWHLTEYLTAGHPIKGQNTGQLWPPYTTPDERNMP